jgi:hypothetical protein
MTADVYFVEILSSPVVRGKHVWIVVAVDQMAIVMFAASPGGLAVMVDCVMTSPSVE